MKIRILTLVVSVLVITYNCKEKSATDKEPYLGEMAHDAQLADNNQTKLVKVDDIQMAFDLMGIGYHKKMMKLMKAKMEHLEGATHGLMITIMDNKTKDIIKGAQVTLSIVHPDGHSENIVTEVMAGAGMHHYATHIDASDKGKYLISASILLRGRSYNARTEFIIDK